MSLFCQICRIWTCHYFVIFCVIFCILFYIFPCIFCISQCRFCIFSNESDRKPGCTDSIALLNVRPGPRPAAGRMPGRTAAGSACRRGSGAGTRSAGSPPAAHPRTTPAPPLVCAKHSGHIPRGNTRAYPRHSSMRFSLFHNPCTVPIIRPRCPVPPLKSRHRTVK